MGLFGLCRVLLWAGNSLGHQEEFNESILPENAAQVSTASSRGLSVLAPEFEMWLLGMTGILQSLFTPAARQQPEQADLESYDIRARVYLMVSRV